MTFFLLLSFFNPPYISGVALTSIWIQTKFSDDMKAGSECECIPPSPFLFVELTPSFAHISDKQFLCLRCRKRFDTADWQTFHSTGDKKAGH